MDLLLISMDTILFPGSTSVSCFSTCFPILLKSDTWATLLWLLRNEIFNSSATGLGYTVMFSIKPSGATAIEPNREDLTTVLFALPPEDWAEVENTEMHIAKSKSIFFMVCFWLNFFKK